MSKRLVGDKRLARDNARPHAKQMTNVIAECGVRPLPSSVPERRVNGSMFVASDERDLKSDTVTLVARIPILTDLRTMHPMLRRQEKSQAVSIVTPHGDVEIGVGAGYSADMEVNRPTAKEPVSDLLDSEAIVEIR